MGGPGAAGCLGLRAIHALLALNAALLALDLVLWVRVIKKMAGFEWFTSQVLYPVSVAGTLLPVVGVLHCTGRLRAGNFRFPKRYFFALGFLGTLQNWLGTVGGAIVSGPTQTVLIKMGLVPIMILSWALLKTRYSRWHIAGAVIVVVAGVVQIIPQIRGAEDGGGSASDSGSSSGSTTSSGGGSGSGSGAAYVPSAGVQLVGVLLLVLMDFIPKSVYVEKYTKAYDLDVVYFRALEAAAMVLLSVAVIPVSFWRVTPAMAVVEPSTFGAYARDALACFAGTNPGPESPGYTGHADCEGSWQLWLAFTAANVSYDVTSVAISKFASAATGTIWSSAALVLTVGLMQWPWLSGRPKQVVPATTVASIALICLGLWAYGRTRERSAQREHSLEQRLSSSLSTSAAGRALSKALAAVSGLQGVAGVAGEDAYADTDGGAGAGAPRASSSSYYGSYPRAPSADREGAWTEARRTQEEEDEARRVSSHSRGSATVQVGAVGPHRASSLSGAARASEPLLPPTARRAGGGDAL